MYSNTHSPRKAKYFEAVEYETKQWREELSYNVNDIHNSLGDRMKLIVRMDITGIYTINYRQADPVHKTVLNFIKKVKKKYNNLEGVFLFYLHDGVSNSETFPHLGFARGKKDLPGVLLPNLYNMRGFNFKKDDIPFSEKKKSIYWRGSTTGGVIDRENYLDLPRIKLCKMGLNKENTDLKISNIVQCKRGDEIYIKEKLKSMQLMSGYVDIYQQYKNRYLVSIDGNCCAWDRLNWILKSNSVCLKYDSDQWEWYFYYMKPYVHYIPFTFDNFDEIIDYVNNDDNKETMEDISKNATQFINYYSDNDVIVDYTYHVLKELWDCRDKDVNLDESLKGKFIRQ